MLFNKFAPESFAYKPKVRFGESNFRVNLGPYPMALISKTLESTGLVQYHQLLVVANEEGRDIYFVTAESNALDGPNTVYLCFFDPMIHGTKNASILLLITPVFFCAASRMVREYLGLDFETAPIIEPERQALEVIPDACDEFVPRWREHSRWVIEYIRDGLPAAHPGRSSLTAALLGDK